MKLALVGLDGPLRGTRVGFADALAGGGTLVLGRAATADLSVDDSLLSRTHCVFERSSGTTCVRDLGSRNGTWLNGIRVEQAKLTRGDQLGLGASLFLVADADETQSAEASLSASCEDGVVTRSVRPDEVALLRPRQALSDEAAPGAVADLMVLRMAAEALAAAPDASAAMTALLELALAALPVDRAALVRHGSRPTCAGAVVHPGEDPVVIVSRTLVERVARDRVAISCDDVHAHPEWKDVDSLAEGPARSVMCVPVTALDRTVGVLWLDAAAPDGAADPAHRRFEPHDLDLAVALASLAALPLASREAPVVEAVAPATEPAACNGHVLVVVDPVAPLDLAGALELERALGLLPQAEHSRTVLVLDHGRPAVTEDGLAANVLDRLALLPAGPRARVVLASRVPAVARLATLVAATLPGDAGSARSSAAGDARDWFRGILRTCAMTLARADFVVLELEPRRRGSDEIVEAGLRVTRAVLPAREMAARLRRRSAGCCPVAQPVVSGLPPILALDGSGLMSGAASSTRGVPLVRETTEETWRKVKSAKTDSRARVDLAAPLGVEVLNVLVLLHALGREPMARVLARHDGSSYADLKAALGEAIEAFLSPVRARRREMEGSPGEAERAMAYGSAALESECHDLLEVAAQL